MNKEPTKTTSPSWSDAPGQGSAIDGRAAFAETVADRINLVEVGQGSTVFGVVGPWGCGKTTLLNDIEGLLRLQSSPPRRTPLPAHWNIVWFSPWSVADVSSITEEFISALLKAFPKADKTFRDNLVKYGRFGTPFLRMIPIAGNAVGTVVQGAIDSATSPPPWNEAFEELSKSIACKKERVLVIVDDVDRLDGGELRALLRVVRLLGRFKNVHYLMAYDEATIEGMLSTVHPTGGGSEFMEKIVQYPFEVPVVPKVARRRWAREILDAVSPTDEKLAQVQADHREGLIDVLAVGLETPRAAHRLREQVISFATLIAEAEVDVLDFVALTWLRVAHHKVWDDIRLNREQYLEWFQGDADEERPGGSERIVELMEPGGHTKPVHDIVRYLFEVSGKESEGLVRRWRMRVGRYFDRYFQIGLAEDDVSERKTEAALAELLSGRTDGRNYSYLKRVVFGEDEEKSELAISVANEMRPDTPEASIHILNFVADIRTSLEDEVARYSARLPTVDRWLSREIFAVLRERLLSPVELSRKFGHERMAASAYVVTRSRHLLDEVVKPLYLPIAEEWLHTVSSEPQDVTLLRSDMVFMTNFLIWFNDAALFEGYLSQKIDSVEALIDIAVQYVGFNEWSGSGVEYEAVFRGAEFAFAVSADVVRRYTGKLPEVDEVTPYDTRQLTEPYLHPANCRDFAIRGLEKQYPPSGGVMTINDIFAGSSLLEE